MKCLFCLILVSCSLHVVHGAFQVGVEATKWILSKIFQAMWKIFT